MLKILRIYKKFLPFMHILSSLSIYIMSCILIELYYLVYILLPSRKAPPIRESLACDML